MKNSKSLKKVVMLLIAASLSTFLLMGCQSSSSSNSTTGTSSNNTNSNRPNMSQMKQNYETQLKALVAKGTINQTQSDKILATLTQGRQGHKPNGSGNYTHNGGNGGKGAQGGSGQSRPNYNPLNKLVQDGTITQDQANTVWQQLRGSFKGGNNGGSNSTQQ
jgi:polyhydroxyalkanoate synthesis regulator phasin